MSTDVGTVALSGWLRVMLLSRSRILAAGFGVFCLGSLTLNLALHAGGLIPQEHAGWSPVVALFVFVVPVAVLLLWHLPCHPVTVILAVYVGGQVTSLGLGSLLLAGQGEGPLGNASDRLGGGLWALSLPLLPLLITVFPDGVPEGRWRWVFRAQVAAVAALAVMAVLDSAQDGLLPVVAVLGVVCAVVLIGTAAVAAVRLAVRAVRDREVRRQVATFAVAALFIVSMYVVVAPLSLVVPDLKKLDPLIYPVIVAALPAAIGYAVLRHRLFGVSLVVNRLLVAGTSTLVLAVIYVGVVLGVAAAFGVPGESLSAMLVPAALVAFVILPAHRGLQAFVARAVYGTRGDPLAVLHTLGQHLGRTPTDDVPDRIVRVLRESLRLPWVALDVAQDGTSTRAAEQGVSDASSPVEQFDLSYAGGVQGHLLIQPRRGERTLGRVDRRLIRQIADQAGAAVAAAGYVSELTLSRERLVQGREAERARLRRDLHDGLSPALAGLTLALTAARQLLRTDPDTADTLLQTAESEASTSWADVRRILDDLRPPGLEELGLVGALEERGRALSRPGEFTVTIAAEGLPPLPTAVETAAYRIAVEAMSNAARHAHARRCAVAVTADGQLHVTVEDDGAGLPTQPIPGVGIQSMQARAADLGGQLRLGPADSGGTRIHADLPIQAAP